MNAHDEDEMAQMVAARQLLAAAELAQEVLAQFHTGYVSTGYKAHARVLADAIAAYLQVDPR